MSRHFRLLEHTVIGNVMILGTDRAIEEIRFEREIPAIDRTWIEGSNALDAARDQLQEYFTGDRQKFELHLSLAGTEFQKRVWRALSGIPWGATISYGELARRVGNPRASRAVGAANGRNPIPIVVPCHRVIGADGSLTGFGGGLDIKRKLLTLEGCFAMANCG